MSVIQKVEKFISDKKLLENGEKVLVAVSGGADSMVLLHILKSLKYDCVVAHCNFRLRKEESDRDEKFISDFCRQSDTEFHSVLFDTYAYMEEKSISLEMAARELRYKWFDELSTRYHIRKIAVAHHMDDSAETILINLIRGSGIKGLTGISVRNGKIIRPLLCLSKEEITKYIQVYNIPFVTDSTNLQDIYTRNKLRLNIIPLLEEINPSFKNTIIRTSEYLSEVETVYNHSVQRITKTLFIDNVINIPLLLKTESPKAILFEILHPYGFNSTSVDLILNAVDKISGKKFYSKNYVLLKDREKFILEKITENDKTVYPIGENIDFLEYPVKLKMKFLSEENTVNEKKKNIIYIDFDLINYPLLIRKWEHGDKFVPFGMSGSKKLSDYFTDQKFSLSRKENIWLLCNGDNRIIWIIGERADNRFRITKKTKNILKIELSFDT